MANDGMQVILVTGGSGFIGTNLIDDLVKLHINIVNVDINKPKDLNHMGYWEECDILDHKKLQSIFNKVKPDAVIHLAARTDVDGTALSDYVVNTTGTKNILDIVSSEPKVKHIIITSTQFVHQYKGIPQHDEDFAPHTVYGQSKVESERLTRKAQLSCRWTIIRPTNVWGPWHARYPFEFWRVIGQGRYIHPNKPMVTRSYGYVKNVVWQIKQILYASDDIVNGQVYYVGDRAIRLLDWVNGFSQMQLGRDVIIVPSYFVKALGFVGDALKILGIKFPITSSRYKSMTTSNNAPMEKTFAAFGEPPIRLEEGIAETVEWMKRYHPDLVKV